MFIIQSLNCSFLCSFMAILILKIYANCKTSFRCGDFFFNGCKIFLCVSQGGDITEKHREHLLKHLVCNLFSFIVCIFGFHHLYVIYNLYSIIYILERRQFSGVCSCVAENPSSTYLMALCSRKSSSRTYSVPLDTCAVI